MNCPPAEMVCETKIVAEERESLGGAAAKESRLLAAPAAAAAAQMWPPGAAAAASGAGPGERASAAGAAGLGIRPFHPAESEAVRRIFYEGILERIPNTAFRGLKDQPLAQLLYAAVTGEWAGRGRRRAGTALGAPAGRSRRPGPWRPPGKRRGRAGRLVGGAAPRGPPGLPPPRPLSPRRLSGGRAREDFALRRAGGRPGRGLEGGAAGGAPRAGRGQGGLAGAGRGGAGRGATGGREGGGRAGRRSAPGRWASDLRAGGEGGWSCAGGLRAPGGSSGRAVAAPGRLSAPPPASARQGRSGAVGLSTLDSGGAERAGAGALAGPAGEGRKAGAGVAEVD
ncbi:N-acetylaspartate synthetase [Crotalus adamanteus]|uniref:N-acetylaspartate synthetase n=1 Tax=Crotalus adamanteus TaxID=8729 RepID=A0AAW1BJP1_CROAD